MGNAGTAGHRSRRLGMSLPPGADRINEPLIDPGAPCADHLVGAPR
jgi:hypothetical protein